jgi:hypothetical protein
MYSGIQFELYLNSPTGREEFRDAQPAMLAAAQELNEDVEGLGKLFLTPEQLAEVRTKLQAFARAHAVSAQRHDIEFPSSEPGAIPQFGWLLNLPLSPFRTLEGVNQTAQAVHELTFVANSFALAASDFPRELSWDLELLVLQANKEVLATLEILDRRQANTQATLQQVRLALTDANNVVARLEPIFGAVQQTANAVGEAGKAVNETMQTYTTVMKELFPPDKPEGRPFDVLEYARTAGDVSTAATELRKLLVEFQTAVQTNSISARFQELRGTAQAAVADTEATARQLADHVAKRAIQVVLIFFATLFAYRLAVGWMLRRGPSPEPRT